MKVYLVLLLLCTVTISVNAQKFVGYWEIAKLVNADGTEDTERLKWVKFNRDKTYSAGRIELGVDNPVKTGVWKYNKKERTLKLESEDGTRNDGSFVIETVSKEEIVLLSGWNKAYLDHGSSTIQPTVSKAKTNVLNYAIWQYDVDQSYPGRTFFTDEEAIYFGTDQDAIKKVNLETGVLQWKSEVEVGMKGFIHSFDQDEQYIYCNGTGENVYKIRKKDGKVVWTYKVNFDDDILHKVKVDGELILTNPYENFFLALDKDGKEVWKTELNSFAFSYTVRNGRTYANLTDGSLAVIDNTNGNVLNRVQVTDGTARFYNEPAIIDKQIFLCDVEKKTIHAFDLKTLKKKWTSNVGIYSAMFASEKMLFATRESGLVRLSPKDGSAIWEADVAGLKQVAPSVFNNKVYFHSREGLRIIDEKTGEIEHILSVDHKSYSQPLVTKDAIYIGYATRLLKLAHP